MRKKPFSKVEEGYQNSHIRVYEWTVTVTDSMNNFIRIIGRVPNERRNIIIIISYLLPLSILRSLPPSSSPPIPTNSVRTRRASTRPLRNLQLNNLQTPSQHPNLNVRPSYPYSTTRASPYKRKKTFAIKHPMRS